MDELIGGYVNLRVAIDLSNIGGKINRDWTYLWLKEPKEYFPDTDMPRYRFTVAERRALVEFILRDDAFMSKQDEARSEGEGAIAVSRDPAVIEKGKRLVELSRCVLCHDIAGVKDLIRPRKENANRVVFSKLASDLRCLSCHRIQGRGGDYAPDLTYAGSKLKMKWITSFLQNPDIIRPMSQQMPEFKITPEEARISAEYIKKNLTHSNIPADFRQGKEEFRSPIVKGKEIYDQKGCRSCHAIGNEGGAVGPDLTFVGDRLESGYIYFHMKNPLRINPYAVEPDYGLSEAEGKALTYFLAAQTRKDREAER